MSSKTIHVIGKDGKPETMSNEDVARAIDTLQKLAGVAMSRGLNGVADELSQGAQAAERAFAEFTK